MDRERVHAALQLVRKYAVDHAVAFDPGLIFEQRGHDIDPEMSLPARSMAGMAFMPVGFVNNSEALRGESFGQLLRDEISGSHGVRLREGRVRVNGRWRRNSVTGTIRRNAAKP
jgi:hypothetical protein